jgi:hypothetical protein
VPLLTVHLNFAMSCPAKAGHPVTPVPAVDAGAPFQGRWLLDRPVKPVKPGDDSNQSWALESEYQVGKGALAPCPRGNLDVGTLRFAHPTCCYLSAKTGAVKE